MNKDYDNNYDEDDENDDEDDDRDEDDNCDDDCDDDYCDIKKGFDFLAVSFGRSYKRACISFISLLECLLKLNLKKPTQLCCSLFTAVCELQIFHSDCIFA